MDHGAQSCKEAPVATNPFCYLPVRFFDRVVIELQMKFECLEAGLWLEIFSWLAVRDWIEGV